jgi:hypothetical protein
MLLDGGGWRSAVQQSLEFATRAAVGWDGSELVAMLQDWSVLP